MSHLLICGAAGYTNVGDDAILWGMLTQLREALPGRALRVAGGPEVSGLVRPFEAAAISYHDRAELARAIEDAELVVLGGGGLLYDMGYEASLARLVGDPPDRQWLYEMARVASAAGAAGRPVMLYGVGVGPLVTDAARRVARFIGEQAKAITVRDRASADALVECGLPRTRVHVAADPAVLVEAGDPESAEALLADWGLGEAPRPLVAMNLRPWGPLTEVEGDEAEGSFIGRAGRLVGELRERLGATVVLLPFQRMNDDDLEVERRVMEAAGKPEGVVLLDPPACPAELVAVLGRFDLMVGMRLHALVLAASAGLPFVALPYVQKVWDFVEAMAWGEHAHGPEELDPAAVAADCEALLRDRERTAAHVRRRRDEMRKAAAISAEMAAFLLAGGAGERRPSRRHQAMAGASRGRMRVLMQIRPDFREKPGGDVVQLEAMLPYLEADGVEATISGEAEPDLEGYDLVHTINLDRPEEPYRHCLNALEQGKPVVVSPVHMDLSEFLEWGDTDYWELPDPAEGLPSPGRAPTPDPIELRKRALTHLRRQALIDWSAAYLPNAEVNASYLNEVFGMDLSRTVVVPNGAKEEAFEASPDLFADKYGLRDFVLCVGRVEKKKNQLGLIAAMRGSGIPLVVVGRGNPESYLELCRRYADENTHFIPHLSEEELASGYAAAKVHALTSWIELPGLTTLEAAAAGCSIVSTDRGSPREYLGDMAWYCDPRDFGTIREAVVGAYKAPRSERLSEHIRANYTWRRAAERTLEGYRLALALRETERETARPQAAEAARQHADLLARAAADREYEARQMREWGETVEAELKKLQEEFRQVTSRRLHRWSAAAARAGWGILRALGVKR